MASLYQPRPLLSSHKYSSPTTEYDDARRGLHHYGGRLSREQTDLDVSQQQQHQQSFHDVISGYPAVPVVTPLQIPPAMSSMSSMSSMMSNIPAPMVPSQSYEYLYHRAPSASRHPSRQHQHRKHRMQINPLYFWPAFRQYRNRQAHKDTQKEKGGVWRRPELENAFVDSVLLMPHMGRRKFSMGGKLHGRNMLISEYIFVICVAFLGSKEIFRIDNSNESIEQMGRKQVSSHMQVVKKFFEDLRCFHFLFPSEEKKEPGSTNSDDFYDEEEQESFKSNPILTALAEGRVPDVKPNYAYFSDLLGLQSLITVRPKTCEIFVSSSKVKIRDDVAYDADDTPLDQASFPHLNKYTNAEDCPHVLGKDVLLHEYTRTLDRVTSACVKTVARRWQKDAPAMYETLDLPTQDEECLLLEMCTTIDLHEHAKFPSGSELTGFVEVAITQPGLQNHHWKCVTRLTRPDELHSDEAAPPIYVNESGIHRRGCSDSSSDCDCHLRPRQDIHVPFPAVQWASILSMAVQYPDVEHQRKREKRGKHGGKKNNSNNTNSNSSNNSNSNSSNNKRKRSEDEGDAASWGRREPTGSDLICKVAMYQELWSRAPDSPQWTRQAILFWRFNTTNQWYKYSPVFKPAGTSWRWLTVNDPMSRHHQQQALVFPTATATADGGLLSRDSVMSPTPNVSQQLSAVMSENFSSVWQNHAVAGVSSQDNNNNNNNHNTHVSPLQTSGLSLFDAFPTGLATPPPTAASMHGSYANAFDPHLATSHQAAAAAAAAAAAGFLPTQAPGSGPGPGPTPIVTTAVDGSGGGSASERARLSRPASLPHAHAYSFDGPKPPLSAGVSEVTCSQYLAAASTAPPPPPPPLGQPVYDDGGWGAAMGHLDGGWTGAVSASAPASADAAWASPVKGGEGGQHGVSGEVMWNADPWHMPVMSSAPAAVMGGGGEEEDNPRAMKRRKTEPALSSW